MSADRKRPPAAFKLSDIRLEEDAQAAAELEEALVASALDPFAEAGDITPAPIVPQQRRHRWARLLAVGIGGLIALAVGLSVDRLVRSLFERTDWLGWLGLGLVALAAVAVLVLAVRELVGLLRLRRITHIQSLAAAAISADDRAEARVTARELIHLYRSRPETARGRKALGGHLREIVDGRDLVGLAETELLAPLDDEARRMVLASAKRVSLVTAISPRALVDVVFVLVEILRLIRRLATLYGGRPGVLGFWSLTRRAVNHLAITGGMAAGESMLQQVLGHGIAARISTRLGEGVINGILTARVGIAAIDVCRPLPFVFAKSPRLSDIMAELTRRGGKPESDVASPG